MRCDAVVGTVRKPLVHPSNFVLPSVYDHEVIRALLLGLGVCLRLCREPIDESATGKLTEHMIATLAQFENDLKSERAIERMKAAASSGR